MAKKTAKKRILIVDDQSDFTAGVKFELEQTGEFEVLEENRGANAVAVARQFKPDVILLDVIMPDRDGAVVVNEIHDSEDLKDTPVIFFTAAISKDEVPGGDINGVPFIPKSASLAALKTFLKNYLR